MAGRLTSGESTLLALLAVASSGAWGAEWRERFTDPQDGSFDASEYLLDHRGVPAARYQDENTGVLEAEGRYYVTPRWIVLGFVGAGRAWGRRSSFEDCGSIVSKGLGFRYVVARRLGLAMGIDVARGPEKTAFYVQVGNAWR